MFFRRRPIDALSHLKTTKDEPRRPEWTRRTTTSIIVKYKVEKKSIEIKDLPIASP